MRKTDLKIRISIGMFFSILILYIIVGALFPFVYHPKVDKKLVKEWTTSEFNGEKSMDRAGLIETSQQALSIRLNVMNQAKKEIWICTFSLKPDRSNHELFSVIWNAANRGVKVHIIADALSAGKDMKRDPLYYAVAAHENIIIRYYNYSNILKPWTINARLHDKIVLVDDKFLILGGRNTSDYFLGEYNMESLSYDREIFVYNTSGSTAQSVLGATKEYCRQLWELDVCKTVYENLSEYQENKMKTEMSSEIKELEKQYELLKATQKDMLYSNNFEDMTVPVNKIEFISNPIHIYAKQPVIWAKMMNLVQHAKERVIIQSPYVILNKSMRNTLEKAGSHLKDFEILTNSTDGGDNFVGCSDYKYSKKKLLEMGVKIYEFEENHSMHNKSMLVDDNISVIGSFNFDMRSVYINTESALVVYGKEFASLLEIEIDRMKDSSYVIEKDGSRIKNQLVVEQEVSGVKEVLYYIVGFVLKPFRFLL